MIRHLPLKPFVRAWEREPEDPVLLERAIFSLLLSGENVEAQRLARTAEGDLEESSSLTRLTLGITEMHKEHYAGAREILNQGEVGPFNRIVSRSISAWAALGENDQEAAQNYVLKSLVGDDVLDGVSLYMLGMIQMSGNDDESALKTFQAVWNERMRLAVACEHYVRLLAASGDTAKALEVTEQFRNEVGANPAVDALATDLREGKAISVRRLSPREGAALAVYSYAAALAAETRDDVASVYFNLALVLDPKLDLARTLLGSTLDNADRREEAVVVLSEVSPDSPFYATSQGQLAWVLYRMGKDEQAIEVALKAQSETKNRDLTVQLGDLYRSMGQFDQAYYWFNDVVERDEASSFEDWRVYYARGIVSSELGNWDAAEDDLQRALEIDPEQPQVLNYLGYSWVDKGRHLEEAFNLIRKAVDLSPRSGFIIDSLGWAYYRLGQYDMAVSHLERAVKLDPQDPTLNDHLGDAYWRAGRELEARFQWRHALALDPAGGSRPKYFELKLEAGA